MFIIVCGVARHSQRAILSVLTDIRVGHLCKHVLGRYPCLEDSNSTRKLSGRSTVPFQLLQPTPLDPGQVYVYCSATQQSGIESEEIDRRRPNQGMTRSAQDLIALDIKISYP